jgi:RNA polymerase sigma-70 factor (ECF subfamily)
VDRPAARELEARLRPFVARRVQSRADVDDVMQDVFLRLQKTIGALREEERFDAWLHQVARSAIADHHRRRARHPLVRGEGEEQAEEIIEEPDDAEALLAAYVAFFIAKLPSPYREALTLTELERRTQSEAAEMLGISLSGMKSRVQRGRALLRDAIERSCRIELDARGQVIDCAPRSPGCSCTKA